MYKISVIIPFMMILFATHLQGQVKDSTFTRDTTSLPELDTSQNAAPQVPDSIATSPLKSVIPSEAPAEPENHGTITEIEKLNEYKPQEVLKELKKGNFGHPINIAKDTLHWKTGGLFAINLNQGSLTNWAAGGDNFSLSLGMAGNLFANYADEKNSWDNNINLSLGFLKTSSQGLRKSDDKIELYSKYGYRFSKSWFYSVLVNFRSQFANGYNYPDDSTVISHFLAPAYVLGSIGLTYQPADYFSVFISPVTSRFVIVNDQELANQGAFGVDSARHVYLGNGYRYISQKGKRLKYELGSYVSFIFKKQIIQNVTWDTRLELYSNYLHDPQNIDIHWNSLFSCRVNQFISASLNTELIYDDDIQYITYAKNADGSIKTDPDTGEKVVLRKGARIQFKELIGLGFSFQF